MSTLKQDLNTIIRKANRVVGSAVIKGHQVLVQSTPLDTGRLRSVYDTTMNSPSNTRHKDPSKPLGHVKGNDIFISELKSSVSQAKNVADAFNIKRHKAVFITNNMVYVDTIDARNGMSSKAKLAVNSTLKSGFRNI